MLGMSQISRELLFGGLAIHRVPTTLPHFYKCNLQQMLYVDFTVNVGDGVFV